MKISELNNLLTHLKVCIAVDIFLDLNFQSIFTFFLFKYRSNHLFATCVVQKLIEAFPVSLCDNRLVTDMSTTSLESRQSFYFYETLVELESFYMDLPVMICMTAILIKGQV